MTKPEILQGFVIELSKTCPKIAEAIQNYYSDHISLWSREQGKFVYNNAQIDKLIEEVKTLVTKH